MKVKSGSIAEKSGVVYSPKPEVEIKKWEDAFDNPPIIDKHSA